MVYMTVLTRVTRKCAIVLRTSSNEIVTSLTMVVHVGWDAQDNRRYAKGQQLW